jgi:outer membrane lipoprotein SlyB
MPNIAIVVGAALVGALLATVLAKALFDRRFGSRQSVQVTVRKADGQVKEWTIALDKAKRVQKVLVDLTGNEPRIDSH